MQRKTLLLIFTYKYPFEPPTEQFLDDEIRYLDREDIDILFVPNAREKKSEMYPFTVGRGNVHICELKRSRIQNEMICGTATTTKKLSQVIADIRAINQKVKPKFRNSIKKLTIEQYVQGGALYQELIRQIPKEYLQGRERIILYSYWLNSMIIAEAFYKEYLEKTTSAKIIAYARAHGDGDLYVKGMDNFRPGIELVNKEINAIFPISDNGRLTLSNQGIEHAETYRLGVKKRSNFLSAKDGAPLIVSCSVINDNKRVEIIAEIISGLKFEVSWVHFGGGPNEETLREKCLRTMPENVRWKLNGWTEHEQVMAFYKRERPNLFINVSKVEGIPVSIMEAMSFSIPCVATNVGASNEIVESKKNGFLLNSDFKVDEVSKIISDFLTDSYDKQEKMRKAAYETFEKKYNSETNYSTFAERLFFERNVTC
jgi:glycosyltransferase involved in cell wall biosynthesis